MQEKRQIEISTGIVVRAIFFILALWFFYLVRDIMALFFFSVILAATLDPIVDWIGKKRIPRPLGTFVIYIISIGIITLAISLMVPPLVGQLKEFNENIPEYTQRIHQLFGGIEKYADSYGVKLDIENSIRQSFTGIFQSSGELFSTTVSVFHFFISFVVVLSLTFYMLVKEEGMKKFISNLTPKANREYAIAFYEKFRSKIGRWVFGQMIVMLTMFAMALSVFSIFKIPFALIIALIAGLLEIVPYIGPIISATIATTFGFLISPLTGMIILASFIVLQQIEAHVIVPQVMRRALGLNPVATILVLMIGIKLGGVVGAILAIPLATAAVILIEDIMDKRE